MLMGKLSAYLREAEMWGKSCVTMAFRSTDGAEAIISNFKWRGMRAGLVRYIHKYIYAT
jgi:hypothetical protein